MGEQFPGVAGVAVSECEGHDGEDEPGLVEGRHRGEPEKGGRWLTELLCRTCTYGLFKIPRVERAESCNTAPQASFSFDYDDGASGVDDDWGEDASDGILTVTHDGGDQIEAGNVRAVGGDVDRDLDASGGPYGANSELSAGSSFDYAVGSDDTVRIVYNAESGGSSATLGRWDGPDT